jgi:hypothetical protein
MKLHTILQKAPEKYAFPKYCEKQKAYPQAAQKREGTSALADTLFSECLNRALLLPGFMKKGGEAPYCTGSTGRSFGGLCFIRNAQVAAHAVCEGAVLYCQYHIMLQTNNQCTIYRFHGQNV